MKTATKVHFWMFIENINPEWLSTQLPISEEEIVDKLNNDSFTEEDLQLFRTIGFETPIAKEYLL